MVRQDSQASALPAFDDKVLKQMYVEYDIPCDPLISDSAKLRSFANDYTERTGHHVELTRLSRHLFNLRKRGEAKGGLPRLRRKYNGRN